MVYLKTIYVTRHGIGRRIYLALVRAWLFPIQGILGKSQSSRQMRATAPTSQLTISNSIILVLSIHAMPNVQENFNKERVLHLLESSITLAHDSVLIRGLEFSPQAYDYHKKEYMLSHPFFRLTLLASNPSGTILLSENL